MFRLILALMVAVGPLAAEVPQGDRNAGFTPAFANQTRAPAMPPTPVTVGVFARGLENPWGISALPGTGWLVTERAGRLRVVFPDGRVSDPVAGVPQVAAIRQGGLLDVTVSPDFARDRLVFWTYAKPVAGGMATAAARGRLSEDLAALTDVRDIFVQTPPSSSPLHFGSRIVFDRAGHVFITTGERSVEWERGRAQDPNVTYGKVIRLFPDGTVPPDNPFVRGGGDPAVWSYGHRNVQGAAIDARGALWTLEHGPAGGDELNRPQSGRNYGWPEISYGVNYDGSPVGTGRAVQDGMEQPVYFWDPVIAPGGMVFYDGAYAPWRGDALIASLNPGALVRLRIEGGRVTGEEHLLPDVGRIRDVEQLPDGSLFVLVDARDGAVLRVVPGG